MKYDFIIVGSGLYGAVFANRAKAAGYSCLILEKRPHVGGNIYTENIEQIEVHRYGAHIFHTYNKEVWDFVNAHGTFNRYTNCPIANYNGEIYNLPFNMNTFNKLWGVVTPDEAKAKIREQCESCYTENPENLEQQALNLVGPELYEKLVRSYTEKQWGRSCRDLPPFIIRRLPLRFTYDNNYFNDTYQGIPDEGYTRLIESITAGIEIKLNTDYLEQKPYWDSLAGCIVFTGSIDTFFGYEFGSLQYRSLKFETEVLDLPNFQGNAVVNYTDSETPYTRIIEHKHFVFGNQPKTIISREYSINHEKGTDPYYPINDKDNNDLYERYSESAKRLPNVVFGGRLGEYKYLNMDEVTERALKMSTRENLKELLERATA